MTRRGFIRKIVNAAAMVTGVSFAAPLSSLRFPGTRAHAAVTEQGKKDMTMKYRTLGKTGIQVSEISFGCALNYGCNPLGNKFNKEIRNLYAKAFELGINLFDTSINADKQYVEEESFHYFKPVRDKVVLCSKVNDFEPAAARASIERTLRRMKTDYIDVVFAHQMNIRGGWDKGVPALEEIRKMIGEGKIRYSGVSDHSYSNLMKLTDYAELVDVILLIYNIKNTYKAEAVISEAKSLDVGTIAIKVLGGGYELWGDKAKSWQKDSDIKRYSSNSGSVAQAAIRFVLSNPGLSSALIGMRSETEIMENVKASSEGSSLATSGSSRTGNDAFRFMYKLLNKVF